MLPMPNRMRYHRQGEASSRYCRRRQSTCHGIGPDEQTVGDGPCIMVLRDPDSDRPCHVRSAVAGADAEIRNLNFFAPKARRVHHGCLRQGTGLRRYQGRSSRQGNALQATSFLLSLKDRSNQGAFSHSDSLAGCGPLPSGEQFLGWGRNSIMKWLPSSVALLSRTNTLHKAVSHE
jgi:hypothetical protein